ncbi:hypothetical protein OWV82_006347 [Melia azedarach]|uniref:Uncharacterized protein n=2 Tax=Melia azedarach TaxID=155640 RepID=A0ACC1YGG7_MELAZ|nr:hypothetical protein OWV82_006347 [Melia azedarach]KAJ4722917.1 hypothetical protein OWV82_006347 [Melia azedarach]
MRSIGRSEDHVSVYIDAKLNGLAPAPPERCIFKVHHQLRSVNEEAYEPEMLAIGPYHRGKNRLQVMEEHKLRYLRQLLERRSESSVAKYVFELRGLEERARNCYAEPVNLSADEFVEMMLVDGFFIIELFRKHAMRKLRNISDPLFNMDWIHKCLVRDTMLFENQLPFFVLYQLFNLTLDPEMHYDLVDIALHFFRCPLQSLGNARNFSENSNDETKHLLDLVHSNMLASFVETKSNGSASNKGTLGFIQCAAELVEAGVKFKRAYGRNLFDIKFKNGTMTIPCLIIEDQTESYFRNLIAYEQYSQDNHLNCISDYVKFMDCLINSSKDVELLCRHRIIENWLGDHEVVATMFNKLGDYVVVNNLCYAEILNEVNRYCCRRWNVWMAKLRRNYFNSPWALLSFLAAVLLLLLTSTQTVFSVLSFVFQ